MNEPNQNVGRVLKEMREREGVTLAELAKETESTPQYISDVEAGRRPFPPRLMKTWSKTLSLDIDTVMAYILADKLSDYEKRGGFKCCVKIVPRRG